MAVQTNALAGIVSLSIDGETFLVAGDAKYQPSGFKRETLTGQDRVHGFSEMPRAGKISMTLRDRGTLSVTKVASMRDSTVVLGLANGKTIVGRNMWNVGDQEVDTKEGTVDIEFEGVSVVEA